MIVSSESALQSHTSILPLKEDKRCRDQGRFWTKHSKALKKVCYLGCQKRIQEEAQLSLDIEHPTPNYPHECQLQRESDEN